jgi:hypothetical protein
MQVNSISMENWDRHHDFIVVAPGALPNCGDERMHITKIIVASVLACIAGTAAADEVDRKIMLQLLPCKSAALRMCDRSQGINAAALWRCSATLAERHNEVGQRCLSVLKQYGQL